MVNKSGNIGTAAETAVVRVLNANGFPYAERRRLRGAKDCGDITGIPNVVIEVKGGNAARNASDAQIEKWLDETDCEWRNANADVGFLVVARKGIGAANAHRWWAIVREPEDGTPITKRYYLIDFIRVLRHMGYGDGLDLTLTA